MTLCASPNALPFASKSGPVPGFQIELGEKIAEQLGVKLTREWVVSAIRYRRADCDPVLDVIARKDTQPAGGVQVSRPYHRSGVVLAVRDDRCRHVSVRVRGRYRCCAGQSRDRGSRRCTDDGRLVQPAARRQAVAPDSEDSHRT
ncbi:hypothetical protein [Bradyrhizobium sp. AZCC 1693]|uniref:hypothetical protein n=1 Tax=Bradyrhizobium sp. AZCC 1693 TaxID=3117029 RepID=UPI002FF1BBC2